MKTLSKKDYVQNTLPHEIDKHSASNKVIHCDANILGSKCSIMQFIANSRDDIHVVRFVGIALFFFFFLLTLHDIFVMT